MLRVLVFFSLLVTASAAQTCTTVVGGPQCKSGSECVNVFWNAPVQNAYGAPTSYTVNRGATSGSETALATGITGLTYQDNAIPAGATALYYTVAAVYAGGSYATSPEVCVQPEAPPSPLGVGLQVQ